MAEERPKRTTRTGQGTPVGPSSEEKKLRELDRDGKLPEGARLRGIPSGELDVKD